jgi:hypothetical protein
MPLLADAAPPLLLVVGDADRLTASDAALKSLLQRITSASVTVVADAAFAWHSVGGGMLRTGASAAVISATCRSGELQRAAATPMPLVTLGGANWAALGLGERVGWAHAGAVRLANASHPLAAGLARGYVPFFEKPSRVAVAAACAGARVVAHAPALPGRAAAFAYDAGAALCGGGGASSAAAAAPARRAALGVGADAFDEASLRRASSQAVAMLYAAVLWASGVDGGARDRVMWALRDEAAAERTSAATRREFEEYARAREMLATMQREDRGQARAAAAADASSRTCAAAAPHQRACPASYARCDDADVPEVTVLVHTCDAYARFWGGWSAHFAAYWRGPSCWPVRFANEFVDPAEAVPLLRCAGDGGGPVAHHAPTGGGPFSSRLDVALRAVPTPLVMYMQEDVWLTGETAAIGEVLACAARLVRDGHFDGVRLEGEEVALSSGLYHLEESEHVCGGRVVHRFAAHSRWLFSHQPGVWRRAALLADDGGHPAVMQPGENPWLNELLGGLRAEARGARVGLIAVDWYRNVADSGALNLEGRLMEEHMQECSS